MAESNRITIAEALLGFVDYLSVERRFSPATVKKYRENTLMYVRHVGNPAITDIHLHHFISLKGRMTERGAHESRIAGVICALKCLLTYARDILHVPVIDLTTVKVPRARRREAIYLTTEELNRFVEAIPLRTWEGKPRISGFRFRAIVETLAATGMRISEVLSLDRTSIDEKSRRVKIIGKGGKERVVFFTDPALDWIGRYLDLRSDASPALFATQQGSRLKAEGVESTFRRHGKWIGMTKPVTPHIIRHTTATLLLQNGCPLGFIKEILGHDRLETTCRFYLGILNKADVEKAYRRYLDFRSVSPGKASETDSSHRESRSYLGAADRNFIPGISAIGTGSGIGEGPSGN